MADEKNNAIVERLLERFSQLKEMERAELALQEAGEGDELNLFILREEILDVKYRLRELRVDGFYNGAMAVRTSVTSVSGMHGEHGELLPEIDEAMRSWDEGRACNNDREINILGNIMNEADKYLSPRQYDVLVGCLAHSSVTHAAKAAGINKSTVSRTNRLAKQRLQRAQANVRKLQNRLEDQQIASIDAYADRDVLICMPRRLVKLESQLSTVSPEELVKVVSYLQNGEAIYLDRDDVAACVSARQMEILDLWADGMCEDAQVNRSTLCRTMQRIGDRLSKSLLWWKDEDLAFLCMKNRRYLNAGRLSSLARGGCLTVEFNGVVHTISEWAVLTGIPKGVIRGRLFECGWSVERALTERPKPRNRYYSVQKERR